MADEIPAQNPLVEKYREGGINQLTAGWNVRPDTVTNVLNPLMDRAAALDVKPENFQTFIALSGDAVTQTEGQDEDKYDYVAFVPATNKDVDGLRSRVAAGISGWGVLPDSQTFVTPDQSRAIQAALVDAASEGDITDDQLKEVVREALETKDVEDGDDQEFELKQDELEGVGLDSSEAGGTGHIEGATAPKVDQKVHKITSNTTQGEDDNLLTQSEVDTALGTSATTEQTIDELIQQDPTVEEAFNKVRTAFPDKTNEQIAAMTSADIARALESMTKNPWGSDDKTKKNNEKYLANVPAYANALALREAREAVADAVGKDATPSETLSTETTLEPTPSTVDDQPTTDKADEVAPMVDAFMQELMDSSESVAAVVAEKLAQSLIAGTDFQIGENGELIALFVDSLDAEVREVNGILKAVRESNAQWKTVRNEDGSVVLTPTENHHIVSVTYDPEGKTLVAERRSWTAKEAEDAKNIFAVDIVDRGKKIEDVLADCFLLDSPQAEHAEMTAAVVKVLVDKVLLPTEDGSQNPNTDLLARALRRYSKDVIGNSTNDPEGTAANWQKIYNDMPKAFEFIASQGFDALQAPLKDRFFRDIAFLMEHAAQLPNANNREVAPGNPEGTLSIREQYAAMIEPVVQNLFVAVPGLPSELKASVAAVREDMAPKLVDPGEFDEDNIRAQIEADYQMRGWSDEQKNQYITEKKATHTAAQNLYRESSGTTTPSALPDVGSSDTNPGRLEGMKQKGKGLWKRIRGGN